MKRAMAAAVAVAALTSAACEGHDFEPPDRSQEVRRAASAYGPSLFDTVSWGSAGEAADAGNLVYVEECRNCHGSLGRGDTEYGRERGLEVPSLVEAEWPKAHVDSVRRAVYAGHEAGMPVFGAHKLTLRQIDAVAAYVLDVLRPDVLGPAVTSPPPPPPLP